jgi:hypothetical protein
MLPQVLYENIEPIRAMLIKRTTTIISLDSSFKGTQATHVYLGWGADGGGGGGGNSTSVLKQLHLKIQVRVRFLYQLPKNIFLFTMFQQSL